MNNSLYEMSLQMNTAIAYLHKGPFTILYQPDKSMQVWERVGHEGQIKYSDDVRKIIDFPPAATFKEMYANEDAVKVYLTFS